ncbi:hypothetical protein AOCH_004372 [Aspergillus ochraceoroseus]|uniref:Chloride channel protein n=1 Tax=Aspergillus ochraceoroseus TaxID=138278 RepID=A0A0F8X162_9EURO|nr:hypothetical protein AOCH_004372 [Aspergillus ochraceoroseus]
MMQPGSESESQSPSPESWNNTSRFPRHRGSLSRQAQEPTEPMTGSLREPISFKRKHKQRSGFSLSNIFSSDSSRNGSFGPSTLRNGQGPQGRPRARSEVIRGHGNLNVPKEGGLLDWYVEGPGRRVGYDDFTAIDWIFEYTKERQRKRVLSASGQGIFGYARKLLDASNVWLVLIATGISVGIIAAFIDIVSDWLGDIKTGYCKNGGFVIRHFMGPWTLAIKSLGLEGPLVHVACCCASVIMKAFDSLNSNEARKREVLSAAAAAGISVAFGAPIGGVLFSLEQLSYYFPDKAMWQSFVCAMVAAVTLQALNPFRTGNIVLYEVKYTRGWHRFEMIPFITLGIVGGLYGAFLIRLNMRVTRWRRSRSFSQPVLEVVLVALLSALINFPSLFMRAQNSELVHSLFAECGSATPDPFGLCKTGAASATTVALLLVAALLGFLLASVTFGLDIPAGIILPSFAIGACYGRALGTAFKMWQDAYPNFFLFGNCEPDIPCVTPGLYAIIGAASALGGATRMTVSIVVIMFELTGALTYVIPIMIAVMLSKWCGDIFGKRGIYESWIHLNEYPFLDHRDDTAPPDVPAHTVMTKVDDITVITAVGHTIGSLRNLLQTTSYRGFPVVSGTSIPVLLGYISRSELSFALKSPTSPSDQELSNTTQVFFTHQPFADPMDTLDLRPWMDQTPITLNSGTTFLIVLRMFQRLGLRYVLFSDKGVLQGLLTKKDVWSVVNDPASYRSDWSREDPFHEGQASEEVGLLEDDDATSLVSPIERGQTL